MSSILAGIHTRYRYLLFSSVHAGDSGSMNVSDGVFLVSGFATEINTETMSNSQSTFFLLGGRAYYYGGPYDVVNRIKYCK